MQHFFEIAVAIPLLYWVFKFWFKVIQTCVHFVLGIRKPDEPKPPKCNPSDYYPTDREQD